MYTGLVHLHSAWRYVVVLLLIVSIIKAFVQWFGNNPFTSADKKIFLFAMISVHIQLVIGLILYFISPYVQFGDMATVMKTPELRYWTVEHISTNIIGIILITVGYSTAKRAVTDRAKFMRTALFYLIGFIFIMVAVPWPGGRVDRGWF